MIQRVESFLEKYTSSVFPENRTANSIIDEMKKYPQNCDVYVFCADDADHDIFNPVIRAYVKSRLGFIHTLYSPDGTSEFVAQCPYHRARIFEVYGQ